jgi:ferredoxin--NADP+ reductase
MHQAESCHVVVIIGGAVAGSEAAFQLASRGVLSVVLEQNERPYGKIEDGLPRWHVNLRAQEEKRIDDKLCHPSIHYVPRTRLGRDLDLAEIRRWGPSAIILALGAWRDRPLPVPGIDQFAGRGFLYQNPFVYWFNHYWESGYRGPKLNPPDGAIVIGGGLASLDVVKILMLETISRALESRGKTVSLHDMDTQGYRKVLAGLGLTLADLELKGCTLYYRRRVEDMPVVETPENVSPEQAMKSEATRRKLLNNFADKYMFQFQGQRAPVGCIMRDGCIEGLRIAETQMDDGQATILNSTAYDAPAPLVISSIGSIPEPIHGVEMSGEAFKIKNDETGELEGLEGIFVVGNAVTGRGNILVSRKHGRTVSQRMLEQYLRGAGSGYEEVFSEAAAVTKERVTAVAERLSGQALLKQERVSAILSKVESLQRRAGYGGNYHEWIRESIKASGSGG